MEQKSAGMLDRLVSALPDFRGKRRLVRYLLRSYMATAKDLTIEGSMSCRYLLPNLKETIAFDLFCNGTYEPETFRFLSSLLERSDAPDIFFEFVDWAEAHAKQENGAAQDYLLGKGYKLFRLDADGRLRPLSQVLRSGTEMLFASKKNAPGMRSPSKPDIDNE